jgi:tape measure domain-containing protein
VADARIVITAETQQAQVAIANLNRSLGNIERSSAQAQKGLGTLAQTTKLAVGAFAALTAGLGVREIVDYTARWTDLNSRLVNATGSQQAAKQALDAISASARTTFSSLEETAKVFVRNSMAMNELGYTTNEQIKLTEALNNGIAVSGARGAEAASALDAFAKSIARGKMEGEDFNRIIETSPRIVKALADGLGVTTGEFRAMITEGKITADVMIPALLSQMDKLKDEAEAMPATISDAFIVLQNSLFEFIGSTDEALGISQALSKALLFLADNTGVLVGAIGGLALAVGGLLIPLIPAATAMAVLTGGIAVAGAIALGGALGYMAQEAGLFAKNTEKAVDPIKQQAVAAADAAAAERRRLMALTKVTEEQKKALKTLEDNLVKLEQSVKFQETSLRLGETEANIRKTIFEEQRKLQEVGKSLSENDKTRIRDAYVKLETLRQEESISKTLEGLQTEMIGLAAADKDQREIVLAIRQQELDIGRQLNEQEKAKLSSTIATTQAMREQVAIKEAIKDATRDQTELEKIQRGLGLQKTVGGGVNQGFVTSQKEYQKDQEALQALLNNKIISEQEYYQQREELARQYNLKIEELELARIQTTLMAERNGIASVLSARDAEVLQRQGANERQKAIVDERIKFEKKSELEKTTFALDNMQTVFAALGQQNKKAFEASKALAIASAIVNTYQAATKALATYPFPFGLIAAAGAVAAGMAQVSAIRSQQYSGRQLGGPVMGNKSYIVGENGPEMFTPTTNGSITRNGDLGTGGGATVNFTIVANDSQGFDDLLIQRQGMIKQMISDAMVERGQRSMI